MDSAQQIAFDLKDRSSITLVKKEASRLAQKMTLSAKQLAELDIIISEISTNLLKHAGGGEIILRGIVDGDTRAVEVLSIDSGPGMSDPARMIEDGVSTTGTLGQGLGAIKRLSDQFQIYSVPGWGTILMVRVFKQNPSKVNPFRYGIYPIVLPKPGEQYCGDLFSWKANAYFLKVMLADGLGHGILAQQASEKAAEAFQKSLSNTPHQILTDMHHQVKSTRGLVATVGVYDLTAKTWQFCGIGNISTRLHDAISSKSYLPYNGIVGVNIPRHLESQTVKSEAGRHLVLCSDGVSSRWDASKHIGAFRCDQSILAAVIYKDFARHSDDTSVVVVKT